VPGTEYFVGPLDEPDKYRLVHQVGAGGEAQLWRAELNVSGEWEPVAVKILRPDRRADLEQWKARWAEQAEVLRFIRHPGVVGVREHFEGGAMHYAGESTDGMSALYLVMNWVDGVALRDWVPLHTDDHFEGMRYLAQIGDVLDWLHSGQATPSGRTVIHADVTPSNVLVTSSGQAVLVDFGLTRLAGGTSPVVEGTRGYMAPEVLAAGEYSTASDRYSFGALTYFALTGQNPPLDPAAIREGLAAVPVVAGQPGLVDHLMKMFDTDPEARPLAGDWIRYFRVSGSTTIGSGGGGLQPTVPVQVEESVAAVPNKRRRGLFAGTVITVIVALVAAGVAYAVTRAPSSPTHGSNAAKITRTTTSTAALGGEGSGSGGTESTNPPDTTVTTGSTLPVTSAPGSATQQNNSLTAFFLSDQSTCCGSDSPEKSGATINGQTFPHSIWTSLDSCSQSGTTVTYDYNLGRSYKSFSATIGDLDNSALNIPVQWDVYLDTSRHVSSTKLVQGQSTPLSIDVTGVLTLTLTVTLLQGQQGWSCPNVNPAWGDAQVSP